MPSLVQFQEATRILYSANIELCFSVLEVLAVAHELQLGKIGGKKSGNSIKRVVSNIACTLSECRGL